MASRPRTPAVGVYAEPIEDRGRAVGNRWRVVVVTPSGARYPCDGRTQDEARDKAGRWMRKLGASFKCCNLTLSAAVELFVDERWQMEVWSDLTRTRNRQDLALLAVPPQTLVTKVDRAFLQAFLQRLARLEFASQRSRWGTAAGFFAWCVARELIPHSPMRLIDRLDKPWASRRARRLGRKSGNNADARRLNSGKTQLNSFDEARAYLAAALVLPTSQARVAAALPLLTNLASGEVRHLQVRDVEFGHGMIWVRAVDASTGHEWHPKSKTRTRLVELPSALRDDLHGLCDGNKPDAFLFSSARNGDGPFNTEWLRRLVRNTCMAADVTVISPHGLRGTYSTVLALTGTSAPEIGAYLGHADGGVTAARHYIGVPTQKPALQLIQAEGRGSDSLDFSHNPIESERNWRSGRDLNPRPPA